MKDFVPAARVSELIGLLYDCAIDPQRWEPALDAIYLELGFVNAALGIQAMPSGAPLLMVERGLQPAAALKTPEYFAGTLELWGGAKRIMEYPLDEPILLTQATGRTSFPGFYSWDRFAAPAGLIDLMVIAFARDADIIGSVAMGRHESQGPVGEPEMAALRLIAPHFRRAVAISRLLELKTVEAATFSSALESLSSGIVLVDEQLGVVHANGAASAMMETGDPIRRIAGKLVFSHPLATAALADAVAHCADAEHDLGRRGLGVPLKRKNGEALVAHVLPLRVGEVRPGLNASATAAIFIAAAAAQPQLPGDALALLYDLTPAESRVFEFVAAGEVPADIANRLGVATATVKTHLLRVFQKTGCNRQADLVKLAGSLAMPY
jgi:DNA-binding CsgD family transcriptional regulator